MRRTVLIICTALCIATPYIAAADDPSLPPSDARRPSSDADLRHWLANMVWGHRFSDAEVAAATGMSLEEAAAAKNRLGIHIDNRPALRDDGRLRVLPYPGGRHPRIGFLDGAIRPQRETKVSIFTPWDRDSYVVADVPEAIWSNLGLTYLAHTHVPTIWSKQGVELEKLEWRRGDAGALELKRTLPNGIAFTSTVTPKRDHVLFEQTLTNGTAMKLTDLRVQNCVMLKGAKGFAQQDNQNKVMHGPYVAASDAAGKRWVITVWKPNHRPWANPPCPCIHSDPRFADCEPGGTVRVAGWLSFFEGEDVRGEMDRIDERRWWEPVRP